MARVIAVVNQKGGVGKTTTAVNLSTALFMKGMRVLLCDFDPQANATTGMGVDKRAITSSVYDVLLGDKTPVEGVISTKYGDVLASSQVLAGAGLEMIDIPHREYLLQKALRTLDGNYDYIFIDCPPSMELLSINALTAADSILVPVQCEYYAMEGLAALMNSLRNIKRKLNPNLEIEGLLLTMYDGRTNLATQVAEEVKQNFAGQVFTTMIPRNVRLSEAPSHGEPIQAYDPHSRGAEAYGLLADEVIKIQSTRQVRR